MTDDALSTSEQRMRTRYPVIEHRPSMVYLLYKESFLIACCLVSLYLYGCVTMPFKIFFLCVSLILSAVILYQIMSIKATRYTVTHDRIKYTYGLLGTTGEKIELYRVRDLTWRKPLLLRPFGYGYITVNSTDYTRPNLVIQGVRNPERLMNIISDRVEVNRLQKRVYEVANR